MRNLSGDIPVILWKCGREGEEEATCCIRTVKLQFSRECSQYRVGLLLLRCGLPNEMFESTPEAERRSDECWCNWVPKSGPPLCNQSNL